MQFLRLILIIAITPIRASESSPYFFFLPSNKNIIYVMVLRVGGPFLFLLCFNAWLVWNLYVVCTSLRQIRLDIFFPLALLSYNEFSLKRCGFFPFFYLFCPNFFSLFFRQEIASGFFLFLLFIFTRQINAFIKIWPWFFFCVLRNYIQKITFFFHIW